MSDTIALPAQGLVLPAGMEVPDVKAITPEQAQEQTNQEKARQLPEPKGWRILCALVEVDDTYESGLIKADVAKRVEELTSPVLFVLKVGPLCYQDPERFPDGPWCKEGDFVITRPYTGTRIKIHGREFRIINDDQVEAVVEDPRGISRV